MKVLIALLMCSIFLESSMAIAADGSERSIERNQAFRLELKKRHEQKLQREHLDSQRKQSRQPGETRRKD
ncbi:MULTISPECIES: hypothetical protein [Pseudomonas]|uniref:hypothetical protein n=1 Tax=Pseudomonas TaxID=286 RepID=UPI0003783748|nr:MULTISPECIES: hypothetical protein [Pseudomonas]MBA1250450.1 hypothetical protein [Pseudomonas zeshuii]MBW5415207.1 hypothetical protein [Pseudomonas sp. MAG002Y]MCG7373938.1 hypothetical protein [Pseudomonas luteola]RRW40544.1 hypothetical protein EGJ52_21495 [Pseudomonas luteola]RRW43120.1 hypothetical protein EGJ50_18995 [Pseudomonas luteola]